MCYQLTSQQVYIMHEPVRKVYSNEKVDSGAYSRQSAHRMTLNNKILTDTATCVHSPFSPVPPPLHTHYSYVSAQTKTLHPPCPKTSLKSSPNHRQMDLPKASPARSYPCTLGAVHSVCPGDVRGGRWGCTDVGRRGLRIGIDGWY